MVDIEKTAHDQKVNQTIKIIKIINDKLGVLNNKLNIIDTKLNSIYANMNNGQNVQTVMYNIPNVIPNISGTQIYNMLAMGWNVDQISYVSGYSYEKIQNLYKRSRGIK